MMNLANTAKWTRRHILPSTFMAKILIICLISPTRTRRRVHNLKYFTWVEQQGRGYSEIVDQWYDRDYWTGFQSQVDEIDDLIIEFNNKVGLIDN